MYNKIVFSNKVYTLCRSLYLDLTFSLKRASISMTESLGLAIIELADDGPEPENAIPDHKYTSHKR